MIEGNKLLKAVLKRSLDQVKESILDGENPELTDEEGRSYLHLSVFLRSQELVSHFIEKAGLDVNQGDSKKITPLHRACRSGCSKIARILISQGANIDARAVGNISPLHIAAAFGHESCIEVLIRADIHEVLLDGVDEHNHTAVHYAAAEGQKACVEELTYYRCNVNVKNTSGNTPLHFAATIGDSKLCQVLIRSGAEVNAQNFKLQTPLMLATIQGCVETVAYLIPKADLNITDCDGNTCSHLAIRNGRIDLLDILMLDTRTDSTVSDSDLNTVLHLALKLGHFNLIRMMLPRAGDLTKQDANGCSVIIEAIKNQLEDLAIDMLKLCPSLAFTTTHDLVTPLHLAAERGMTRLTRQLLIEGAQVDAVDSSGLTPSLYCAKNDHVLECLAMIENIMMDSDNSMEEQQQQQQQQQQQEKQQHVKGDSSRLSSRISS